MNNTFKQNKLYNSVCCIQEKSLEFTISEI